MESIKEEMEEINNFIKKYPHIKDFYLVRAKLYTQIGEYTKAIKDYESVTNNHIGWATIGICRKYHLLEEVEKHYKKEIKADKNNFINYISRAYFYTDINKKSEALADCKTALKLCPKNKLIIEIIEDLIKKLKFPQKDLAGKKLKRM